MEALQDPGAVLGDRVGLVAGALGGVDVEAAADALGRLDARLERGLLDITDNVRGEEIIPPERTTRYDPDDPYLVVAADKGTATFSDTASC